MGVRMSVVQIVSVLRLGLDLDLDLDSNVHAMKDLKCGMENVKVRKKSLFSMDKKIIFPFHYIFILLIIFSAKAGSFSYFSVGDTLPEEYPFLTVLMVSINSD